ncbi:HAD family hydrolase [Mucilaginibacter sp.]
MTYNDIAPRKQAFIFELDNVLYPEKDYLYQVYYLFAAMLEYTELLDAKVLVSLMTRTCEEQGAGKVFETVQQKFKLDGKYLDGYNQLMDTVHLPLRLLLYQPMLTLLQDIVVDRKQIFILTSGKPERQLNKIKQTEWHHLDPYLTCYFAEETAPKPEPDSLHLLLKDHNLQRRDVVMIGNSTVDELCAEAGGVDYFPATEFLA